MGPGFPEYSPVQDLSLASTRRPRAVRDSFLQAPEPRYRGLYFQRFRLILVGASEIVPEPKEFQNCLPH
jgi:hypothetical protein